jgi:hypothetical protein
MALAEIGARIEALRDAPMPDAAEELLRLGERILEHWLIAHDRAPTSATSEGFRLLALHRQAAQGNPSFNACRETARELVYHRNLVAGEPDHPDANQRVMLAACVALHLYLFVSGKLEQSELGEFCCSSRPVRSQPEDATCL